MEVLKFRIETDLRARQERLRGKAAAMDVVDRLLQRNQELFADETSARNATRAAMFEQLKLETQRIAAVSGGQDALLNAKLVNASLDAELARSKEALANQALLAATRASGRGKKSMLDVYNEALKNQQLELQNREQAAKVGALENPASTEDDLGSVEGKRAADRKQAVYQAVKPMDDALEAGRTLLKVGIPSVITRGKAATPGVPLTAEENAQMSALRSFTIGQIKAHDPRISDKDLEQAVKDEIRQSVVVSQEALLGQVKQKMESARRMRDEAASFDPAAAREFERSHKQRSATSIDTSGPLEPPAGSTRRGG